MDNVRSKVSSQAERAGFTLHITIEPGAEFKVVFRTIEVKAVRPFD